MKFEYDLQIDGVSKTSDGNQKLLVTFWIRTQPPMPSDEDGLILSHNGWKIKTSDRPDIKVENKEIWTMGYLNDKHRAFPVWLTGKEIGDVMVTLNHFQKWVEENKDIYEEEWSEFYDKNPMKKFLDCRKKNPKTTRTIRTIEESGKIDITAGTDLKSGDTVEVYTDMDGVLTLKPFQPSKCVFLCSYNLEGGLIIKVECDGKPTDELWFGIPPFDDSETLRYCQKWMDEHQLYDTEYKVFIEIH